VNKLLRTLFSFWRSRRAPKLRITDVGRMRMQVRPTDIDTLGHINNGVYLSLADLGRFDLLVRAGVWAEFQRRGWYPVVANATISYRRSLDLWQRYVLETKVVGLDDRAVYIEQRFVVDGEIFATLFLRGRFLKRSGGTVSAAEIAEASGIAPDALPVPEWMARWAADVALPSTRQPAPSTW
jgi:acyl-CoA thioesterase FadM